MRALMLTGIAYVAALLSALWPINLLWAQDASSGIGKETARINVGASIVKLAWSPDGRRVVVRSTDAALTSVNPTRATRDWRVKVLGTAQDVTLAFVGSGTQILTAAVAPAAPPPRAALHLWDARTGASVRWVDYDVPMETLQPRVLRAFAVSDDGTTVASSGDGRSVLLHDTRTWMHGSRIGPIQGLTGRPAPIIRALFDKPRDRFIGGRILGEVFTWSISSARQLRAFKPFEGGGIGAMALAPRTGHVVVGGDTQTRGDPQNFVAAFDPAAGTLLQVYRGPGFAVRSLTVSNDGRLLAAIKSPSTIHGSGRVLVWEVISGRLLGSADLGQSLDEGVVFSPDGQYLAYAANSTVIVVKLDSRMRR